MDPITVIIVLTMHLVGMGALFHQIGRRMPAGSGLGSFAAASMSFGLAYASRLAFGMELMWPRVTLIDAMMFLAALLFADGLRRFLGRRGWAPAGLLGVLTLFVLLHATAALQLGQVGRFMVLNVAIGLIYLQAAVLALRERRRDTHRELRAPLALLGGMVGLLALLTLARAAMIGVQGAGSIYQGLAAQVYFAYAVMAAITLSPCLLWMVFSRLNQRLAELAELDPLTRLLNRHGLAAALRRHYGQRAQAPISMLQVDVDHFKRINDRHGHGAGDAALRQVATLLAQRVRAGDFVARTGGEEFLVGCVGADTATARALAERLREAVAQSPTALPGGRETLSCTVSVGLSQPCAQLSDWEEAVRQADHALYAAKAAGRNRVMGPLVPA